MAIFRYCATDLLTGTVLADSLPLNVQSFGMNLNGSGTLTGTLNLNQVPALNAPFIAALTCRRAVLWALADDYPVWCGVMWDWPQMSMAQGTLQVSAQTLDSLWGKRLITDTIEYRAVDLFTVFIDLCLYGMSKNSPYIAAGVSPAATRAAGLLSMFATQGKVARLILPQGIKAGVTWTASHVYSDLTQISSAWGDMCASGNLEYSFAPGLDANGDLAIYLRLGYTALGRPLRETGIILSYPGNVLDYGWTVTGAQSANFVWATAPPNGATLTWMSQWPHGADQDDLASFPVLESTVSWQGSVVTAQAQVDNFADGQVAMTTEGMTTPVVNVGGGAYPQLKDIQLGDGVLLALTSPLHPAGPGGQPGVQQEVRVTSWTCYPPGPSQSEYVQYTTSAVIAA